MTSVQLTGFYPSSSVIYPQYRCFSTPMFVYQIVKRIGQLGSENHHRRELRTKQLPHMTLHGSRPSQTQTTRRQVGFSFYFVCRSFLLPTICPISTLLNLQCVAILLALRVFLAVPQVYQYHHYILLQNETHIFHTSSTNMNHYQPATQVCPVESPFSPNSGATLKGFLR